MQLKAAMFMMITWLPRINKLTHPGEKRMVQAAKEEAELLPDFFEENIECFYAHLFSNQGEVLCDLERIYKCLADII